MARGRRHEYRADCFTRLLLRARQKAPQERDAWEEDLVRDELEFVARGVATEAAIQSCERADVTPGPKKKGRAA